MNYLLIILIYCSLANATITLTMPLAFVNLSYIKNTFPGIYFILFLRHFTLMLAASSSVASMISKYILKVSFSNCLAYYFYSFNIYLSDLSY